MIPALWAAVSWLLWRKNAGLSLLLSLSSRMAYLLQCAGRHLKRNGNELNGLPCKQKIYCLRLTPTPAPRCPPLPPSPPRSRKPSRVNRGFSLCGRHQIPLSSPQCPHRLLPPLLGTLSQRLHSHMRARLSACAGKQIPQGHFHPEPLQPTARPLVITSPFSRLARDGSPRCCRDYPLSLTPL